MECTKCKLKYVSKAETELNLRINNHHKDVLKLNAIPADRFQNTKLSKESIVKVLKKHEKFWTKKLETPRTKGLSHELN